MLPLYGTACKYTYPLAVRAAATLKTLQGAQGGHVLKAGWRSRIIWSIARCSPLSFPSEDLFWSVDF